MKLIYLYQTKILRLLNGHFIHTKPFESPPFSTWHFWHINPSRPVSKSLSQHDTLRRATTRITVIGRDYSKMSAFIYRLQTSHITVLPKIQFGFPSDAVEDNTEIFSKIQNTKRKWFLNVNENSKLYLSLFVLLMNGDHEWPICNEARLKYSNQS